MTKLTVEEKKTVNAGAAAFMGIATGILTVTGVMNLIMDLVNRYWGGKSKTVPSNVSECGSSLTSCREIHPELWYFPETPSNRITILSDPAQAG